MRVKKYARAKTTFIAAVISTSGYSTIAGASAIISDDFGSSNGRTVSNGENVQGLTPDLADLPGGTYTSTTQNPNFNNDGAQITTTAGNPAPAVDTFFNTSVSIPYNGNGYTAPSMLNVSADFEMFSINSGGEDQRGEALGFYPSAPPEDGDSSVGFTGILVTPSGGLQLEVNGAVQGSITSAPAGWTNTNFFNLSYNVNTATGRISSVIFGGQDFSSDFSSTTAFTGAAVNVVGFYGDAAGLSSMGYVDNFQVATVPEPASLAVLGVGGLVMLRRRRT